VAVVDSTVISREGHEGDVRLLARCQEGRPDRGPSPERAAWVRRREQGVLGGEALLPF